MTAAPKSRKQTILLVDDEAIVRSLTMRTLEDHGYGVIEAHDGFDAMALLESMAGRIDLVVSDVVMPRLDGIELARCIEIMPHPPPILLMSGCGLGALEPERPLLAKPFRPDELLAAVRHLLAAPGQDDMGGGLIGGTLDPGSETPLVGHPASSASSRRSASRLGPPDPSEASMSPPTSTVLLVDDEEGLRRLLARVLEDSGFGVVEAENGLAALLHAARREGSLGLVVTDISMPVMDGLEFAQAFRLMQPGVPILFMTGKDPSAQIGPDRELLLKPFALEAFLKAVTRLATVSNRGPAIA
jgi:hypothetical protein